MPNYENKSPASSCNTAGASGQSAKDSQPNQSSSGQGSRRDPSFETTANNNKNANQSSSGSGGKI